MVGSTAVRLGGLAVTAAARASVPQAWSNDLLSALCAGARDLSFRRLWHRERRLRRAYQRFLVFLLRVAVAHQ
jgi:hypothetical protein